MVRQRLVVLRVLRRVASGALVVCVAAWTAAAASEFLHEEEIDRATLVAGNTRGEIVTFDSAARRFKLFSAHGELQVVREVTDARLEGETHQLALRDTRALVTYFDLEAGSESRRRAVVVDLGTGRVVGSFFIDGVVMQMAGGRGGWVVLARRLGAGIARQGSFAEAFTLQLLSDDGRVLEDLEFPKPLEKAVRAAGHASPGALAVRPFVAGDEVWFVPLASYELWRPKQGTKSARAVQPPECLAAAGRSYDGEEAEKEILRRLQGASSTAFKEKIQEMVARSRAAGRPMTGFVGAPAGVSAFGWRAAVVVRDAARADGGCRIDVWDLNIDALVSIVQLEPGFCPGFVSLHEDGVWVWEGSRLHRVPLEVEGVALEEPCVTAAKKLPEGATTALSSSRKSP